MKNLTADIHRYCQLIGSETPNSRLKFILTCISPRFLPVTLLRMSEYFYVRKLTIIAKLFSILNLVIFGIEASPKVRIGGGLFLPHTVGTVIGAEKIGENVTIMQGVTIGAKIPDMGFDASKRPVIGNNVMICAGAKIIGRVTIGDYATIGANAVVTKDIPAHSTAVGVPARVLQEKNINDLPGDY